MLDFSDYLFQDVRNTWDIDSEVEKVAFIELPKRGLAAH